MTVTNILIGRVIAHDVVRASQLQGEHPPVMSDELILLDAHGNELVGKRLVDTISSGSHCVDVSVEDSTVGSPFDRVSTMLDADDADFISTSRDLANQLSSSQTSGAIKSGSAIFLQGTCLEDSVSVRFMAIIKADSDQGFSKTTKEDGISLVFVDDMILGESQRLIKVAFFVEELKAAMVPRAVGDFSVKVFDHMMQNSGNANAAVYFYKTFLRCKISDSASRRTKAFYDSAREYIDALPIPTGEKVELRGDLIAYLRSNAATVQAQTFAQTYLPQVHQDGFINVCRQNGMDHAITKNIDLLKGKLRRQSIRFSSSITLFASPEAIRSSVRIESTSDDGWTSVKIRGTVEEIP